MDIQNCCPKQGESLIAEFTKVQAFSLPRATLVRGVEGKFSVPFFSILG